MFLWIVHTVSSNTDWYKCGWIFIFADRKTEGNMKRKPHDEKCYLLHTSILR